jgi:hypothetical protein
MVGKLVGGYSLAGERFGCYASVCVDLLHLYEGSGRSCQMRVVRCKGPAACFCLFVCF